MTELEHAESLLEIIADELNVKELVLFTGHNHDPNDEPLLVQVIYKDKHLRMYKNGQEEPAPKSLLAIAEKWLDTHAPIS